MLASRMETLESETLIDEVEEMSGRADVTLDPDTANPFLILASDQRGVGRGNEWTSLPNNPERFDTEPCVLGSQGFAAGRHCWQVEVAEAGDWWAVGVAQESVRRKGVLSFTPQEGIWAVGQWFGQYHAFSDPDWTPLHLTCLPRAIQVCLDFTDKQVTFADAESEAPIFAFCLASCAGERLRPWLWVGMDSWLKLCPDREKTRGAGERLERQTPSPWVLMLGAGRVLHPDGFSSCGSSGHQGEDWQVMEVDATTEPPLSPHPSAGTAGTTGSTEMGCREELGAQWSPGRDHH